MKTHQAPKPVQEALRQASMKSLEIAQKLAHMLPEKVREKFIGQKPIEMRPVKFHNPLKGSVEEPHRYVWFRANGSMPDDQRIHQYLLGYASDFNFLPTALQPHGVGFLEPGMQVATIDHSMWFHRPFRMDDWLLYASESPVAAGSRGLASGRFFTREGLLATTVVQEALIKYFPPTK